MFVTYRRNVPTPVRTWKVREFPVVGLRPVFFFRWCDTDRSEPRHFILA